MSYSPQTIKRLSAWCLCVLAVPTCWPYSLHIHHNVTGVCVCWPSPHICLTAYIYIIMWLGFVCRVGQNHIYTVYLRRFWQGNHQIYCHIRCIYTVLANPTHTHYALHSNWATELSALHRSHQLEANAFFFQGTNVFFYIVLGPGHTGLG